MQKIIVYYPDGREEELPAIPKPDDLRRIIGTRILERVRVLDSIVAGRFNYCPMFVDEEGLLKKLPRNPKATELYQANVRAQFPGSTDPFGDADKAFRASLPEGVAYVDGTPRDAVAAGYKSDPWIAGPAVVFRGYSVEDAERAIWGKR